MSALTRLKTLSGIDVLKEVESKGLYAEMASTLQLTHERFLVHTCGDNPEKFCKAVFDEWLARQSPRLHTWENLLQVLRDINMAYLAKRIDQFFQSKESEVMEKEKGHMDSQPETTEKMRRALDESEEQVLLLKAENKSLSTQLEVLRQQLMPTGMVPVCKPGRIILE